MNFAGRIADAAARYADRPAIEVVRASGLETTSYAELMAWAGQVTHWLAAQGIDAGDRIAILADNDAAWVATYLGILQLGAVAVPLDTAYKAAQVHAVLEHSGARLILTTPRYLDTAKASDAPRLALLNDIQRAPRAPSLKPQASVDAAVILYTSGTTADPKGVVLTHANLDAERRGAFEVLDVGPEDAVLGVLPLFHALAQMANLLLPLTVGARVVFLETVSSSSLLDALTARGITIFACVPQFFYLIHQRITAETSKKGAIVRGLVRALLATNVWLRDRARWNAGRRIFARAHLALGPRMRLLITGGSRFDPAIARDLYGLGFTILNGYGLTESCGAATVQRPADRFTTSVGQAFPGVEIRTDDFGEILIRGPIVMREYFRRPEATAEAIRGGWLYTGDLGHLDADGRVYITGRKKEIIVLSSGKNLYPEEIETHYLQGTSFKEMCVLGLSRPGEPAAERLHAVIVPDVQKLGARGVVNLRELVRFELETRSVSLPAHKRILTYDIALEPLPRTTTGKIKRHEVERAARERVASAAAEVARAPTDDERAWLDAPQHTSLTRTIATRLDRAVVLPDANLELDLGLDSMERVELLTTLEQAAGTRVSNDVRATIFTIRQLVDAVIAAAPARAEDAASDASGDLPWDTVLAEDVDREILDNLRRPKWITAVVLFAVGKGLGLIARVCWGFRTRGQEHLPREGAFIISPNHQTFVDGIVVCSALPFRVFRRLFLVGAAEYFESRFMAWFARSINVVPVDADANLIRAMRAGASGLRLGKVLILFPEGERSIDGTVRKFRKGAAILSAHAEVPVVPVALDGLFEIWPRGRTLNWRKLLPWSGMRVRLEFLPPIQATRGRYAEDTGRLKDAVVQSFVKLKVES